MRIGTPTMPTALTFAGDNDNRRNRQRAMLLIGSALMGLGIGNGIGTIVAPDLGNRVGEAWNSILPLAAGVGILNIKRKDEQEAAQEDTFSRQTAPLPGVKAENQAAASALLSGTISDPTGKKGKPENPAAPAGKATDADDSKSLL